MINRRDNDGGTEPGCDGAAVFVLETCSDFICLGGVRPRFRMTWVLGGAQSGALGSSWSSGKNGIKLFIEALKLYESGMISITSLSLQLLSTNVVLGSPFSLLGKLICGDYVLSFWIVLKLCQSFQSLQFPESWRAAPTKREVQPHPALPHLPVPSVPKHLCSSVSGWLPSALTAPLLWSEGLMSLKGILHHQFYQE